MCRQWEETCRQRSVNAQTPKVSALFKRAVSVLSALCQRALDGDWEAERGDNVRKQRVDIWRQRSGNAQTMEKKEAVIIDCSEMRTEGTSRSSVGMLSPACLPARPHGSKKIESLQYCAGS